MTEDQYAAQGDIKETEAKQIRGSKLHFYGGRCMEDGFLMCVTMETSGQNQISVISLDGTWEGMTEMVLGSQGFSLHS